MYIRPTGLFWGLNQKVVNRLIKAHPQMTHANTDHSGNCNA